MYRSRLYSTPRVRVEDPHPLNGLFGEGVPLQRVPHECGTRSEAFSKSREAELLFAVLLDEESNAMDSIRGAAAGYETTLVGTKPTMLRIQESTMRSNIFMVRDNKRIGR
ncbi:hypothetical protein Aduo_015227 [Ancylostoma duodenale]